MEEKLTTNISTNVELCDKLVDVLKTNFVLIYWPYESQWHISIVYYFNETIVLNTIDYTEPDVDKYTSDELLNVKKITLHSGCIIYNDMQSIELSNIALFAINAHINTCIYLYNTSQTNIDYMQLLSSATSLKPMLSTLLQHKSIRSQVTQISMCIFDMIDLIKLHTNTMVINKKDTNVNALVSSITSTYDINDTITTIYTDEIRFKQLLIYLTNNSAIIIVTIDANDHIVFDIKPDKLLSELHLNICDKLSRLLQCTLSIVNNCYTLILY